MRRRQPAWCRLPPIVLSIVDLSESILAKLHESIRIGSNDARILQTDKGDKHTDTSRYGKAEVLRNTLQYLIADIEEGDGQEDKCLKKQLLAPLSALLMYFPASAFSPYLFPAQKSFFSRKSIKVSLFRGNNILNIWYFATYKNETFDIFYRKYHRSIIKSQ